MKIKQTKGFTLIELLVVISIVSLLASVVLSALNISRAKATDAAIKEQMFGLRNQIELYRETNSNYGDFDDNGQNQTFAGGVPGTDAQNGFQSICTSDLWNLEGLGFLEPVYLNDSNVRDSMNKLYELSGFVFCSIMNDNPAPNSDPATIWSISARLKSNTELGLCMDNTGVLKEVDYSTDLSGSLNNNPIASTGLCN